MTVRQDSVFLGEDFEVGPGPKFHVYLVPKAPIRASGDLAGQMFVDLGRLRAFKGSQRYQIPAGVDLEKYQSVIIWCEQFSVLISPADLSSRPSARAPQSRDQGGSQLRAGSRRSLTRAPGWRVTTQRVRSGPQQGLAPMPAGMGDLVALDPDVAQHPLIEVGQRLCRAARRELGQYRRPPGAAGMAEQGRKQRGRPSRAGWLAAVHRGARRPSRS